MSWRAVLRQSLILLVILLLLVAPSWLTGQAELRRAGQLAATGQNKAAALAYASAARRLFWKAGLWEQAGLLALAANDAVQANQYFDAALQRDTLSPQGWIARGDAFYQLGATESARQAWEHALPEAEACRRLARLARREKSLNRAITLWQQVLAQQPDDAEASYTLGLLLTATAPQQALPYLLRAAQSDANLEEAVHALRTSLNRATSDPASWYFQGGLGLTAVQAWDLAEVAFRHALALQADHADAWAWLGETLQQQGQSGEAELHQALQLAPDSATVQALYALSLQRQGQNARAITAFQKALALAPEEAAWWAALGGAYEQDGNLSAALTSYRQAAQLRPQDTLYWRVLIQFCLRHRLYLQTIALPATQTLLHLAPDAWYAQDLLGQVLLALGDMPGAQVALEKALKSAPRQPEPYLHLAQLYLEKGDRAAACHALQHGQMLNPAAMPWEAQRLWEQFCSSTATP